MRYHDSVEIGLPRPEVMQLISDPASLPMWLRGLVSHEPVSGAHGEVGTVSRVVLRHGSEVVEATETVTARETSEVAGVSGETELVYERELVADGMRSVSRDRLIEINARRTRWESENEYWFDSRKMRLLAPLMRSAFQKQSRQHMRDFKAFAEQGIDVRSTQL